MEIKNRAFIVGVLLLLLFSYSPESLAINYFRCEKTEDCGKAYTGCGRYGSVHQRYVELYEAKARKTDTVAFCLAPKPKHKELNHKGVPRCIKQKCRLVLPKEA